MPIYVIQQFQSTTFQSRKSTSHRNVNFMVTAGQMRCSAIEGTLQGLHESFL